MMNIRKSAAKDKMRALMQLMCKRPLETDAYNESRYSPIPHSGIVILLGFCEPSD